MTTAAPPRKRAIIMTRLSSYAGKEDTSTSPERQLETAESYCAAKDWEVIAVIQDLDVSASDKGLRMDRPGLVEARALYPVADVFVVPKLDRLARNVKDFMTIEEEAREQGVDLVLIAEGLDLTTPSGRFVATILAAFAELEAATISQRTREAVAYLARVGRHRGGNAPYGWQITELDEGAGYRLTRHPEQAPRLYEVVEHIIAGKPVEDICDAFRADGIPGPGDDRKPRNGAAKLGPRWEPDALRRLLRRPILRGMQVHRGDLVRDDAGLPIRPHDALVTDAEWRDLQAALNRRGFSPRPGSRGADFLLLRGLVACAACGSTMHAVSQEGKPPVWVCSRKVHTPAGVKCPGAAISRARLEEYVVAEVLRTSGHLPGTEIVEEERVDDEMYELSDALDAVLRDLRDVDDEDQEATLLARRRALRARLKELQNAPVLVEAAERPTGTTFAEDYTAASDEGKTVLLRAMLAVVAIKKGKRGKKGLDPSRVTLLYQPTATAASTEVRAGVVYREAE